MGATVVEALVLVWVVLGASSGVGADLVLTPATEHLVLGSDGTLAVEVRGPEDLSELVVTTNHGTLTAPKQLGPGQFRFELVPPSQTWPQVAILAAEGRSGGRPVHGVVMVPLWGVGDAKVLTQPFAEVSVTIAGKVWGPIRADKGGVGTVTVEIPPGVREGFSAGRAIRLGLPRSSLIHLSLDRPSVLARDSNVVGVRLYAANEDGSPTTGAAFLLTPTAGNVAELRELRPGVYEATWKVPSGKPGAVELSAWKSEDPMWTSTIALALRAGAPASLTLQVQPGRLVAGAVGEVNIAAHLADASGDATDAALHLSTSLGIAGPPQRLEAGHFRAALVLPDRFEGAVSVTVRAEAQGVHAELTLPLEPGQPDQITIAPGRLEVVTDGEQSLEVGAFVLDRFGNPTGAALEAHVRGRPASVRTLKNGEYRVAFTPARALRAETTELDLEVGSIATSAKLELLGSAGRWTVAPRIGLASNFGNATSLALGAETGVWGRLRGQLVGVLLEVDWFFVQQRAALEGGALGGLAAQVGAHFIPLGLLAAWSIRVGELFRLRATAGGGITFVSSRAALEGQVPVTEGLVLPSASGALALTRPLGLGAPFLEARFWWHGGAPRSNTLSGDLLMVAFSLGYTFDLH